MYYTNPSVDTLAAVYSSVNAIDIKECPILTPVQQQFLRMKAMLPKACAIERRGFVAAQSTASVSTHSPLEFACSVQLSDCPRTPADDPTLAALESSDRSIPLSIPLLRSQDELGDINVARFLKIFGESAVRIWSAIMAQQRVLFVGYNHPASDLAQMVFTAVALCSPPLHGVIRRAVPYATLSDLSFLEV
jgi:hypothetical protein